MASPDILAMGTYVDRGRNLRGRLMAGHSVWIALGRTRYAPSGDNPWTDEANPPVENPADDETSIDTEMTGGDLVYGVPYKKASSVQLVKLDPSGSIDFDGQQWSASTDADAKHIYFKFVIEPEDFLGVDETIGTTSFSPVTGYRRIEVLLGTTPPASIPGATAFRRKQLSLPGGETGRLLYYSNELLIERQEEERHVIEVLLLC